MPNTHESIVPLVRSKHAHPTCVLISFRSHKIRSVFADRSNITFRNGLDYTQYTPKKEEKNISTLKLVAKWHDSILKCIKQMEINLLQK